MNARRLSRAAKRQPRVEHILTELGHERKASWVGHVVLAGVLASAFACSGGGEKSGTAGDTSKAGGEGGKAHRLA
jgi:hypothetical protein